MEAAPKTKLLKLIIETVEDGKLKCTFCGKEAFGKNRRTGRPGQMLENI